MWIELIFSIKGTSRRTVSEFKNKKKKKKDVFLNAKVRQGYICLIILLQQISLYEWNLCFVKNLNAESSFNCQILKAILKHLLKKILYSTNKKILKEITKCINNDL